MIRLYAIGVHFDDGIRYGKGEKESLSASDLKKVVKLVEELLDD